MLRPVLVRRPAARPRLSYRKRGQLLCRARVEGVPGGLGDDALELGDAPLQLSRQLRQLVAVDADADRSIAARMGTSGISTVVEERAQGSLGELGSSAVRTGGTSAPRLP